MSNTQLSILIAAILLVGLGVAAAIIVPPMLEARDVEPICIEGVEWPEGFEGEDPCP
ncbi:MAG: hypothetical protein AAGD09_03565 [Cyanobacteria bacterium P01_F01_bin.56]